MTRHAIRTIGTRAHAVPDGRRARRSWPAPARAPPTSTGRRSRSRRSAREGVGQPVPVVHHASAPVEGPVRRSGQIFRHAARGDASVSARIWPCCSSTTARQVPADVGCRRMPAAAGDDRVSFRSSRRAAGRGASLAAVGDEFIRGIGFVGRPAPPRHSRAPPPGPDPACRPHGTNINGTWSLYVMDTAAGNRGVIRAGRSNTRPGNSRHVLERRDSWRGHWTWRRRGLSGHVRPDDRLGCGPRRRSSICAST